MRNRIILLLMSALLVVGGAWLTGCNRSGDGHEGHDGARAQLTADLIAPARSNSVARPE